MDICIQILVSGQRQLLVKKKQNSEIANKFLTKFSKSQSPPYQLAEMVDWVLGLLYSYIGVRYVSQGTISSYRYILQQLVSCLPLHLPRSMVERGKGKNSIDFQERIIARLARSCCLQLVSSSLRLRPRCEHILLPCYPTRRLIMWRRKKTIFSRQKSLFHSAFP